MKQSLQLFLTTIVLSIVIIGFIIFFYLFDGYVYQEVKKQAIEDNKVIGEAVIKIIEKQGGMFSDSKNSNQLINSFQTACDQIKLPNDGYLCVARNDGELLAAPGLKREKNSAKDKPTLNKATYSDLNRNQSFKFKDIEKGKSFTGYYEYPQKNYSDLVVGLPYMSDYRVFVHQNNHSIKARAGKYFFPMLKISLIITLVCGLVIYFSMNYIVGIYERKINVKNQELQQSQEEITSQRDFIHSTNLELSEANEKMKINETALQIAFKKTQESEEQVRLQNTILQERDRQISSSINAALAIQRGILPNQTKLNRLLKEYFIVYKPKDIVSGDFYWLNEMENQTILVVGDCTGHGVPGAFMTLIGNSLLDKIVRVWKIIEPSAILSRLHEEVQTILQQKETRNNYGMDMVVVSLESLPDKQTKVIFAGAKNSLFYAQGGSKEVSVLNGCRKSIGGEQNEAIHFQSKEAFLQPESLIYLSTDGFLDQNDVRRKRFGSKRFIELLAQIAPESMETQKNILDTTLQDFSLNTEQRDDILVLGIKV